MKATALALLVLAQLTPPPRGRVLERGTRLPLPEASVLAEGLLLEVDPDGSFALPPGEGELELEVHAAGHASVRRRASRLEPLVLYLEPEVVSPYESTVRGGRTNATGAVTLRRQELLDVAGTFGEPLRVVRLLPGAHGSDLGVGYPSFRGTPGVDAAYVLDQSLVLPTVFHVLGPAVLHPALFERLELFSGNAPARYGATLGAAVDTRLRRPRQDGLHAEAYADTLNAGAFVEAPLPAGAGAVALGGRYAYSAPLIEAMLGSGPVSYSADFHDYFGRLELGAGPGRLRVLALGSFDAVGSASQDPREVTEHVTVGFHRFDARYRFPLAGGEAEAGLTWGDDLAQARFQDGAGEAMGFRVSGDELVARLGYSRSFLPRFSLALGLQAERRREQHQEQRLELTSSAVTDEHEVARATALGVGAHAELGWTPVDGLSIEPGLRVDLQRLAGGPAVTSADPRLRVRGEPWPGLTLQGAVGLYHRPPVRLSNFPVLSRTTFGHGLQEALTASASVEWQAQEHLSLGAAAFFSSLRRKLELNPMPNFDPSAPALTDTFGQAQGFELFVRHSISKRWFGWLSYAYQRSTRWTEFPRRDAQGQVVAADAGLLPYPFDRTHNLNLAASVRLGAAWTVGAVFHWNTGEPENGWGTSLTRRMGTSPSPPHEPAWVPEDLDQVARMPPFVRVDARVSRLFVFDTFLVEAYLDVLNASFTPAVQGFTYTAERELDASGQERVTLVRRPSTLVLVMPLLGARVRY